MEGAWVGLRWEVRVRVRMLRLEGTEDTEMERSGELVLEVFDQSAIYILR